MKNKIYCNNIINTYILLRFNEFVDYYSDYGYAKTHWFTVTNNLIKVKKVYEKENICKYVTR